MWVTDGMSLGDIAARLGWGDVDSVERRVRREIVDKWPVTPAMRHALIACPVIAVRQVIDRFARGVPPETPWERLVVQTYTGTNTWVQGWWADDLGDRQRVIDALVAHCTKLGEFDAGLPISTLVDLTGVALERIRLMASEPQSRGGRLTAPLFGRVLEKDTWNRGTKEDEKRVRVRSCPWCLTRTVTLVRRVPEAETSPILCSTCLRRPDDAAAVAFPAEYGPHLVVQPRRARPNETA
jgi:hypothetical protein